MNYPSAGIRWLVNGVHSTLPTIVTIFRRVSGYMRGFINSDTSLSLKMMDRHRKIEVPMGKMKVNHGMEFGPKL